VVDVDVLLDNVHFEFADVGVFDVDGSVVVDVDEDGGFVEFSGDTSFDVDTVLDLDNGNLTLQGSFNVVGGSSGYARIAWNETSLTIEGNLSGGHNMMLNVSNLHLRYGNLTLTAENITLSTSGVFAVVDENGNITFSSTASLTMVNIAVEVNGSIVSINGVVKLNADTHLNVGKTSSRNFVEVSSSILSDLNATFTYNNETLTMDGGMTANGSATGNVELWWNSTGFGIIGDTTITGEMQVTVGDDMEVAIDEFLLDSSVSFEFGQAGAMKFCKVAADHLELNTHIYFRYYNSSGNFDVNMTLEGAFTFMWW
ncbi:MAG: hypothetical protein J7L32_01630, partial [Thermoplasmata archaeon]|nr:hypothetical protein [Thermoplasmata archaeon]